MPVWTPGSYLVREFAKSVEGFGATVNGKAVKAEKVNKNAILFLQPEWSKREEMTPLIVDYVMNNPKWRVSLQTHKYLNIP